MKEQIKVSMHLSSVCAVPRNRVAQIESQESACTCRVSASDRDSCGRPCAATRRGLQEMDQELEKYHKSNAQLELTISDMKLKQDGLKNEVIAQRGTIGTKAAGIKAFQHDLHSAAQSLQVRCISWQGDCLLRRASLHQG